MQSSEAKAIVNALLTCTALFGRDYKPNYMEMASFEYRSGQTIMMNTFKNGTKIYEKKIPFNDTNIEGIRLQLSKNSDGTLAIGGQVTKNRQYYKYCGIIGDDNRLRLLRPTEECRADCLYKLGNFNYKIRTVGHEDSLQYDMNGTILEEAKQPQFRCKQPLGIRDDLELFVLKKDGKCLEAFYSDFKAGWAFSECRPPSISYDPEVLSPYFHLRYLTTVAECILPDFVKQDTIDNTYVQFKFQDPTRSTTAVAPTAESPDAATHKILTYVAYVMLALAIAVIGLVVTGVVFRRQLKNCFNDRCKRGNKHSRPAEKPKRNAIPPPSTQLPLTTPQKPAPVAEKVPVPRTKSEKVKSNVMPVDETQRNSVCQDSFGVVDDNLVVKSANPLDMMSFQSLDEQEAICDKDFADVPIPKVINCFRKYFFVNRLGAGSFGAVYRYKIGENGTEHVAVKFIRTPNEKLLNKAKREFLLIRQIQRNLTGDLYVLEVLDGGFFPRVFFMVMPLYERDMSDYPAAYNYDNFPVARGLIVAYHYLQGILQLQQMEYAHLDLKPTNYMQKFRTHNTIVLCDFGFMRMFKTLRRKRFGTPHYMSLVASRKEPVSNVDDMQSWVILLCELIQLVLPWEDNKFAKMKVDEEITALMEEKKKFFETMRENLPNAEPYEMEMWPMCLKIMESVSSQPIDIDSVRCGGAIHDPPVQLRRPMVG